MDKINSKRLGLALGITGSLLYFGCALIMLLLGHDATVKFFNTMLHGFDVASIIRMEISPLEVCFGVVQTFILGWLIGASIAFIYNITLKTK